MRKVNKTITRTRTVGSNKTSLFLKKPQTQNRISQENKSTHLSNITYKNVRVRTNLRKLSGSCARAVRTAAL